MVGRSKYRKQNPMPTEISQTKMQVCRIYHKQNDTLVVI